MTLGYHNETIHTDRESAFVEFERLEREVRRIGKQLDAVERDVWRLVNRLAQSEYEPYR